MSRLMSATILCPSGRFMWSANQWLPSSPFSSPQTHRDGTLRARRRPRADAWADSRSGPGSLPDRRGHLQGGVGARPVGVRAVEDLPLLVHPDVVVVGTEDDDL